MPTAETPAAAPPPAPTPPSLPTQKTTSSGGLDEKLVVIYGPPGVGKSTLASQWGGGGYMFLNCAGELGEIEVFQQPITSWREFREYSWALAEQVKNAKKPTDRFPGCAIDTLDALSRYCQTAVRTELGIRHESEMDWGQGYDALRTTFAANLSKLVALPNFGVLIVAHADEKKVKTRSAEYDKWQIRAVKSIRETAQDSADLVLFLDFADDDEKRVIKTKPSRYYDAKERGATPRLPAEIEWPVGTNGYDIIKAAWEAT